ncbi:hypothetical protein SAMN05421659_10710 [[Clostridium] fimetarium]|uniref:Uncharacterized protein n=1 Tax=[Clostridium] fimetarium TaxID=99656 RepID=A0A1I0Q6N6_9FIRM|nr:hypothetical protein SAMN05421659_10710 [[Clostridium] fimetarium]
MSKKILIISKAYSELPVSLLFRRFLYPKND